MKHFLTIVILILVTSSLVLAQRKPVPITYNSGGRGATPAPIEPRGQNNTSTNNEAPSVTKLPRGVYALKLTTAQQQAVDKFLDRNRGLRLGRYEDNKDAGDLESIKTFMQSGEMQFPFAAWGDFNKDRFLDVALLFFQANSSWQIVVFHGNSASQYTPIVVTKGEGVVNGLMYRRKENKVAFAAFEVAEGYFRWNGSRYVVKPLRGD